MATPRFDPSSLTNAANESFTVRRVFGEAYERAGTLVIPVRACGVPPARGRAAARWGCRTTARTASRRRAVRARATAAAAGTRRT